MKRGFIEIISYVESGHLYMEGDKMWISVAHIQLVQLSTVTVLEEKMERFAKMLTLFTEDGHLVHCRADSHGGKELLRLIQGFG
jgi:hypothetical protein